MREYVYYLTENGKRRVTVVILKSEGLLARGVAICNVGENLSREKDEFNRKKGLLIARGRAAKALKYQTSKKSSFIANDHAAAAVPDKFAFKSEFNPELTQAELELMAPYKTKAA